MALFGWDLLYSSVQNDIKDNQDILICLTHLVLVSNGFKCIGLGESKTLEGSENKSEALPPKWNENYSIRYIHQGRLYIFKATPMSDAVMMNLIRVDEKSVSLLQLNTKSVAGRIGTLDEMIPDNRNIVEQIKRQLIDQVVVSKKSRDCSSQTEPDQRTLASRSQDRIPSGIAVPLPGGMRVDPIPVPIQPVPLGSDDLHPFGGFNPFREPRGLGNFPLPGGGGGMLFRPPGPGNLPGGNLGVPRGSIPPGARFDPFRPPDVDRFPPRRPNRPDNDEFPPPGYDDMFM